MNIDLFRVFPRRILIFATLAVTACSGGGGGAPDTTAPQTSITGSPAALTNASSATFTFASDEANSTFEVSVDGGPFADATNPFQATAVADGQHTLAVRARDASGNVDQTPASLIWTVDTQAPDTNLTTTPPPVTDSTSATFQFTSTEANSTFEVSVDNGMFTNQTSPLQLSGLANGMHVIVVRAVDAAANADLTPSSYSWTITDTTPPTAKIIFPTRISYTDAGTLTVRGSAQDDSGISSVSVNGVSATTTTGFASWTAAVPITSGDQSIAVTVTDSAGNVTSPADVVQVTNNGFLVASTNEMDVDSAGDRLLIADGPSKAIVATDLTNGRTTVLSDEKHGSGTISGFGPFAVDGANNRAIVIDGTQDLVFRVDLATGNRSEFPILGASASTRFTGASGIAVNPAGTLAYVSNIVSGGSHSIVEVDLSNGFRRVISNETIGTGIAYGFPLDIVYDNVTTPGSPRLLVSDNLRKAIIAVDIATGDRTVKSSLSPFGTGTVSGPFGTGPSIEEPGDMEIDSSRSRLLVIDRNSMRNALLAIDLSSGNRTTLQSGLDRPSSLAVSAAHDSAYMGSSSIGEISSISLAANNLATLTHSRVGTGLRAVSPRGLVAVGSPGIPTSLMFAEFRGPILSLHLATGVRTVASGPTVGSGPTIFQPIDMALDLNSNPAAPRLLVLDQGTAGLVGVDLASGDRTVISSLSVGAGTTLGFPRGIALDPTNNRALVTDTSNRALFAIDLTSGDRTVLSDIATGSGDLFVLPAGVALDNIANPAAPRALIADHQRGFVTKVNLSNGDRSVFAAGGGGVSIINPINIFVDAVNHRALITDTRHNNVMSVDLLSGNNPPASIVSGGNATNQTVVGGGPRFISPSSIYADSASNVAFVVSGSHSAIMAVDLLSGDRVVISR